MYTIALLSTLIQLLMEELTLIIKAGGINYIGSVAVSSDIDCASSGLEVSLHFVINPGFNVLFFTLA